MLTHKTIQGSSISNMYIKEHTFSVKRAVTIVDQEYMVDKEIRVAPGLI